MTTTEGNAMTHYTSPDCPDLGTVASVWYQAGWRVRLQVSPDEVIHRTYVTEEAARNVAARHAASL